MKDDQGNVVNLSEELDRMRKIAAPEYREDIIQAMESVSPYKRKTEPTVRSR